MQIIFYLNKNLNKLNIKCQSYPKSKKIDALKKKIVGKNPNNHSGYKLFSCFEYCNSCMYLAT